MHEGSRLGAVKHSRAVQPALLAVHGGGEADVQAHRSAGAFPNHMYQFIINYIHWVALLGPVAYESSLSCKGMHAYTQQAILRSRLVTDALLQCCSPVNVGFIPAKAFCEPNVGKTSANPLGSVQTAITVRQTLEVFLRQSFAHSD